jgi:hypothetical protein
LTCVQGGHGLLASEKPAGIRGSRVKDSPIAAWHDPVAETRLEAGQQLLAIRKANSAIQDFL